MSWEFFITSLIVIILPGTGVLYTVAIGLGRGFVASIYAAFGCTLGIIPAAIASILGLAAIFHTSAVIFQAVKFLGVVYLIYMAWNVLRDQGAFDISEERQSQSAVKTAITGTLINVLNPKLSLFFMAFLPQFVDVSTTSATTSMFLHAGYFMLFTFIVFVGYGAMAATAREHVLSRPSVLRWLKRSFALAFGFLGLRLALADR